MKTIVLNGSPRKNWNTASLLKEAAKGAESAGTETEYIDLYGVPIPAAEAVLPARSKACSAAGAAGRMIFHH